MILIHFILRHKVLYHMHKFVIVIHYIYRMQTFDSIVLNKKIRYLDPAAICEAKHASPKWMKDDDDHLKSFETKRQNKRNKKDFIKRPSQMLRPTYDDMMGRHGCHICVIPHPVSLMLTIS